MIEVEKLNRMSRYLKALMDEYGVYVPLTSGMVYDEAMREANRVRSQVPHKTVTFHDPVRDKDISMEERKTEANSFADFTKGDENG